MSLYNFSMYVRKHCHISLAVWILTNIFECEAPDDAVPAALGVEERAGDADL